VLEGQSEKDLMESSLDTVLKLNQLLDMKRDYQEARNAYDDYQIKKKREKF